MSDIDFTFLKEHLQYDQKTGEFEWVKSPARAIKANTKAGRLRPDGYVSIQIKGRLYFAHRIAWLIVYGEWPKDQIDHINRNRSDNRFENLRCVSRSQNGQNRKPNIGSASGHPGVTWSNTFKRWRAHITKDKKPTYLGSFKTLDEAISARKKAEKIMFSHAPLR
jgi:hypothetical protein